MNNEYSKRALDDSISFLRSTFSQQPIKTKQNTRYSTLTLLYVNTFFAYLELMHEDFYTRDVLKQNTVLYTMFFSPYELTLKVKND